MLLRIQVSLLLLFAGWGALAKAQEATTPKAAQSDVVLGVLEDFPGEYAGEPDFRAVRAVFKKIGADWQALPTRTSSYHDLETLPTSYPREMTWSVAFDGRNLGAITSRTPPRFKFYSEIGIEQITSDGPIPTAGKRSAEYGGFTGTPAYRPLVAISQPNFSDPEQWKLGQLSSTLIASVRQQFRSKFPKATNCKNPDENVPRPWRYRDEDIKVAKGYSSKNGWSLVELNLTGYACDGPDDGSGFVGQWYVVQPSGVARYLGTDMWLVDAGDYDNDGKSEVLFSIDGYDKGGYRLFYQDFDKSAEFVFSYH